MTDPVNKKVRLTEPEKVSFTKPQITELDRNIAFLNDKVSGVALVRLQWGKGKTEEVALFVSGDIQKKYDQSKIEKKVNQLLDQRIALLQSSTKQSKDLEDIAFSPEMKAAYQKIKDFAIERFSDHVHVEGSISNLHQAMKKESKFDDWKAHKRNVLMRKDFEIHQQSRVKKFLSRLGNLLTKRKFKTSAEIADDFIHDKEARMLHCKEHVVDLAKKYQEVIGIGDETEFYLDFPTLGIDSKEEQDLILDYLMKTEPTSDYQFTNDREALKGTAVNLVNFEPKYQEIKGYELKIEDALKHFKEVVNPLEIGRPKLFLDVKQLGVPDNETTLELVHFLQSKIEDYKFTLDPNAGVDFLNIDKTMEQGDRIFSDFIKEVEQFRKNYLKESNPVFRIDFEDYGVNSEVESLLLRSIIQPKIEDAKISLSYGPENAVNPARMNKAYLQAEEMIHDISTLAPRFLMDNRPKFDFNNPPFSNLNEAEQTLLNNKYIPPILSSRPEADFPPKIWRDYQQIKEKLQSEEYLSPINLELLKGQVGAVRSIYIEINQIVSGLGPEEKGKIINLLNQVYKEHHIEFILNPKGGIRVPEFVQNYQLEMNAILANLVKEKKGGVFSRFTGRQKVKTFLIDDSRYTDKEKWLIKKDLPVKVGENNRIELLSEAHPETIINNDIEKIAQMIQQDWDKQLFLGNKDVHIDFGPSKYTPEQMKTIVDKLNNRFKGQGLLVVAADFSKATGTFSYVISASGESYSSLFEEEIEPVSFKHQFTKYRNVKPHEITPKGGVTMRRRGQTVRPKAPFDAMPAISEEPVEEVEEKVEISSHLDDQVIKEIVGEIGLQSFSDVKEHIIVDFSGTDITEEEQETILSMADRLRKDVKFYRKFPDRVKEDEVMLLKVMELKDKDDGTSLYTVMPKTLPGYMGGDSLNKLMLDVRRQLFLTESKHLVVNFTGSDLKEDVKNAIVELIQKYFSKVEIHRKRPEEVEEQDVIELAVRYKNPLDGFESLTVTPLLSEAGVHQIVADIELQVLGEELNNPHSTEVIYLDFSESKLALVDQKKVKAEVDRFFKNSEIFIEMNEEIEGKNPLCVKIIENPHPDPNQLFLIKFEK